MSLSLQLPPPIQSGYFGWAETGFPLSYLKFAPPPVSNVLEMKPTILSPLSPIAPLTTITPTPFKSDLYIPNAFETPLDRYNQLCVQENRLVQSFREATDVTTRRCLTQQIQALLQKKIQELIVLGNMAQEEKVTTAIVMDDTVLLRIDDQPLGNVVANKYLEPPLVLSVADKMMGLAREGRLQVRASLCLTLTEEPIDRTIDNKQEILQGNLVALVGIDGKACFNKLKIMEVSSKHRHQSFSIQLQLEEMKKSYTSNEEKITAVGNPIKSSPLHVQSRINKRRRTNSTGSSGGGGGGGLSSSAGSLPSRKRSRADFDSSYVDITSLLVLPQKEAATRLGISESMLCKRFKECTRRKWPYRYLRKIDKMLNVLTLSKKGEAFSQEDLEKIEKLKFERAECLNPVKIRITGHDMDLTRPFSASGNRSTSSGSLSREDSADSYDEGPILGVKVEAESRSESEQSEDDEIAAVVSTLNLMRRSQS